MPMRRRMRRWAACLLPLLVARLFVPVGFMLSPSGEGLGIFLCPGYAALPTSDDHAMHGESHEPEGTQGSEHRGSGQSICPFVLAGSSASCPVNKQIGELPRLADAVPDFHSPPAWISPAVLIDRIRGPPLV